MRAAGDVRLVQAADAVLYEKPNQFAEIVGSVQRGLEVVEYEREANWMRVGVLGSDADSRLVIEADGWLPVANLGPATGLPDESLLDVPVAVREEAVTEETEVTALPEPELTDLPEEALLPEDDAPPPAASAPAAAPAPTEPSYTKNEDRRYALEISGRKGRRFKAICSFLKADGTVQRKVLSGTTPRTYDIKTAGISCNTITYDEVGQTEMRLSTDGELVAGNAATGFGNSNSVSANFKLEECDRAKRKCKAPPEVVINPIVPDASQ